VLDGRARARFFRSRSAVAGAGIVAALVLFAIVGPMVSGHGPLESDFAHGMTPQQMPVGPCAGFPLGADRLFRDVLSRLAFGGRTSLLVAAAATLIATTLGALVGIVSGWFEGTRVRVPWPAFAGVAAAIVAGGASMRGVAGITLAAGLLVSVARRFRGPRVDVDGLLMRLVDAMLAFPFLLLVMAVGAALDRATVVTIFVTLGLTGWLGIARLLRAKTLQVRSLEYVQASRAVGQSTALLMARHVLPNVAGPLVITATVQVAQMIVADSVLNYLGVGVSPPTPTWGRMLLEGQDYYLTAPWLVAAPAVAILLAVWGFNLLGEGLRDALEPREG
jgi:ABC-type dipeptide/oligopeptide/nickel transport system permease subunit